MYVEQRSGLKHLSLAGGQRQRSPGQADPERLQAPGGPGGGHRPAAGPAREPLGCGQRPAHLTGTRGGGGRRMDMDG